MKTKYIKQVEEVIWLMIIYMWFLHYHNKINNWSINKNLILMMLIYNNYKMIIIKNALFMRNSILNAIHWFKDIKIIYHNVWTIIGFYIVKIIQQYYLILIIFMI
jgi:hypothetical protein